MFDFSHALCCHIDFEYSYNNEISTYCYFVYDVVVIT